MEVLKCTFLTDELNGILEADEGVRARLFLSDPDILTAVLANFDILKCY